MLEMNRPGCPEQDNWAGSALMGSFQDVDGLAKIANGKDNHHNSQKQRQFSHDKTTFLYLEMLFPW